MFLFFFTQEIASIIKRPSRLLQNILFFIMSCSIFFLMAQGQADQAQSTFLIINIIWITLLFALLFANGDFLAEDYRDGTLEQMIIFCPNLEIYIAAKIMASWLLFALPILFVVPFVMLASGLNQGFVAQFLPLAFFASIAINFICAFCGSLNIAGNKAFLLAILTLPLIIPVLLIGCSGLAGASFEGNEIGAEFYSALKILCGICIFAGAISVVATAKIVKILSD